MGGHIKTDVETANFVTTVIEHMAEIFFSWRNSPQWIRASSIMRGHDHTLLSVGPLISPSQRPLPDNTKHSQEADSLPSVGIEQAIPASERLQTQALDRGATGIDIWLG